jgi:Skp family chaperone for outer membrane proteins
MRPVYNFNKILPNIYRQQQPKTTPIKKPIAKINFNELFQHHQQPQQTPHQEKQPHEEPIVEKEEEKREIEYFTNDVPQDWFI